MLNVTGFLLIAAFVCTFIYLVLTYPDAPIRTCGDGRYCGRRGQPSYSQQDHDDFWIIAYSLAVMFVTGAGAFAIAQRSAILGTKK